MDASDYAQATAALVQARRDARKIDPLPAAWEPADMAEAYRLQRAVVAAFGPIRAWKVSGLTAEQRAPLGITEPMSAPLVEPWVQDSPARWPHAQFITPRLECEFAFELRQDLPRRDAPYSRAEVEDAVSALRIVMEIVDHRVPRGQSMRVEVADAVNNGAFVIGPAIAEWKGVDIAGQAIVLRSRTGSGAEEIARGTGRAILDGDPFGAVVLLANAQPFEPGLRAGHVVTTGSCTGAIDAPRPGVFEADFDALGRVALTLD